ncbi:MAG TPA: hypothetical protein DD490_06550 [Acidobacteria bacterium]|nr:hypothetical protein [Acidobacteriota bacterium]
MTRSSPEGALREACPADGPPRAAAIRRRAYDPPELIEWGSLVQITLGGSGIEYDIDNGATKAV